MSYTEYYSDIKKGYPVTIRAIARHHALSTLAYVDQLNGISDILSTPRVQFIYLHHTFRDEEEKLRTLLRKLEHHHTWISYSDAVHKVLHSEIDKPYICISSDDGFRNNLQAARICSDFGITACFFINPTLIGETDFEKIAGHCKERLHLPPVEFLNWDEVHQLQRAGHEIGSHTMRHINIAETSPQEVEEDMYTTYEVISRHCGHVKHFAFPYGRFKHFTALAKDACFNAGFISCATAERGCHINHGTVLAPQELCIRRDHVILDWKLSHVMYFLAQNARAAQINGNLYPKTLTSVE